MVPALERLARAVRKLSLEGRIGRFHPAREVKEHEPHRVELGRGKARHPLVEPLAMCGEHGLGLEA